MKVGRSPAYRSLSNMPLLEVPNPPSHAGSQSVPLESGLPNEEGWLLDIYPQSVRMSPYLVAVVITEDYMAVESDPVDGGPITKVWAPRALIEKGMADYAAKIGPPLIQFYEETYGIK